MDATETEKKQVVHGIMTDRSTSFEEKEAAIQRFMALSKASEEEIKRSIVQQLLADTDPMPKKRRTPKRAGKRDANRRSDEGEEEDEEEDEEGEEEEEEMRTKTLQKKHTQKKKSTPNKPGKRKLYRLDSDEEEEEDGEEYRRKRTQKKKTSRKNHDDSEEESDKSDGEPPPGASVAEVLRYKARHTKGAKARRFFRDNCMVSCKKYPLHKIGSCVCAPLKCCAQAISWGVLGLIVGAVWTLVVGGIVTVFYVPLKAFGFL